MRFEVYVTVWGGPYVEKYLTTSLASQLAPGNLPALAREHDFSWHIYTDRASAPLLEAGLAGLRTHAAVDLLFYEDVAYRGGTLAEAIANSDPASAKHNVQRVTSQHFLEKARGTGAAAMLLDSDFIFADGAWAELPVRIAAGAKAVCAMFLRLEEEQARPRLRPSMAPRELVRLGLDALHPLALAQFIDAEPFSAYPSQLNWRVGSDGFVTHCFFPHPLVVMADGSARYSSTMDYEFALRAVADDAQVHLITNSDELLLCKMTPARYLAENARGGKPTLESLGRFIVSNTNRRHRHFMAQPIRFRAGGDEAAWREVEARSTRLIEAAYKAADLIVAGAAGDPRTLMFLKSYLGPIEDFLSPQMVSRMKGWM